MSRVFGGPEPESVVERYFLPSETIAENVRLHWSVVIEPFMSALLSMIFAFSIVAQLKDRSGAFDDVLILAALAMILRLVYRVLEWDFDRFIVTNRRIALVTGLIYRRRVAMMPLERVTDMTFTQTVPGRIFGWGTFVVESAGQEQALRTVDRIPYPDDLYRTIMRLLFAPNQPAVAPPSSEASSPHLRHPPNPDGS